MTTPDLPTIWKKLLEVEHAVSFDLVRLKDCKEKLGISQHTLRRWEREGGFKIYYTKAAGGRCAFASKADIIAYIKEQNK